MIDRKVLDRGGLLHLLVVYIVWGSTYLAKHFSMLITLVMCCFLSASTIFLSVRRAQGAVSCGGFAGFRCTQD